MIVQLLLSDSNTISFSLNFFFFSSTLWLFSSVTLGVNTVLVVIYKEASLLTVGHEKTMGVHLTAAQWRSGQHQVEVFVSTTSSCWLTDHTTVRYKCNKLVDWFDWFTTIRPKRFHCLGYWSYRPYTPFAVDHTRWPDNQTWVIESESDHSCSPQWTLAARPVDWLGSCFKCT